MNLRYGDERQVTRQPVQPAAESGSLPKSSAAPAQVRAPCACIPELEGAGMTKWQRGLYGLGVVVLRYIWARADQFSASQHWGDLPRGWDHHCHTCGVFVCLKPVSRRSIADNLSQVWSDIGPGTYGMLSFLKACIVVQCTVLRQGFSSKGTCRQCRLCADVCMDAWPCRSWGWLVWRGMRGAETAFKLASLLNFLAFLRFGNYRCATAPAALG